MTKEEIIKNKIESQTEEMEMLLNAPEPIPEVADNIWFIGNSRGYYFFLYKSYTLEEVQEILHGKDYKLEGYCLSGSCLEVEYIIEEVKYTFKITDAETILPILSNGKCTIEEYTPSASRRVVCEMND